MSHRLCTHASRRKTTLILFSYKIFNKYDFQKYIASSSHNSQVHNTIVKKRTNVAMISKGLTNIFKSLIYFIGSVHKQIRKAEQGSVCEWVPLPPYCSSTHGLAYAITLTKADGNFWGVMDWLALQAGGFRQPLKYINGLNLSCRRVFLFP